MPATSAVVGLLDAVIAEQAVGPARRLTVSFAETLEALYAARYTGAVTFHLRDGRVKVCEIPNPVQVALT